MNSNEDPFRPPSELSEKTSSAASSRTSVVRGTSFGCLYVIIGYIAFGVFIGLLAPLVFDIREGRQRDFGAAMARLFVLFGVLPLWIVGFIRHRRLRR